MTASDIREMHDGTCLLLPGVATAKKAAVGWSVHSHIGRIWQSVRNPNDMVAIRFVANKAAARRLMLEIAKR